MPERTPGLVSTETEYFASMGLQLIEAELREEPVYIEAAVKNNLPILLNDGDIKGVVHTHTTYSDGQHTIEQMATAARDAGYTYIVITDHSQSAFYANGLKPETVYRQFDEIDIVQVKFQDFKIFKGIESDILNSGALDYEEELLKSFDLIIASIHSNLKMEEAKANNRLIQAIENPHTKMLGHPTGRLLLSRKGYPIESQEK